MAQTVENAPRYDGDHGLYNLDAEKATLGALLVDRDAILQVSTMLQPADFYQWRNQEVYRAIYRLYKQRVPADLVTVSDALEVNGILEQIGGTDYLSELIKSTPVAVHAGHHAQIVFRESQRRRALEAGTAIANLSFKTHDTETIIDQAAQILRTQLGRGVDLGWYDLKNGGERLVEALEHAPDRAISSGFHDLDDRILSGGFYGGELNIIAARTGIGKSALALQLLHEIGARQSKPIGLISLEMSLVQVMGRLVAVHSGIEMQRIKRLARYGKLQQHHWEQIMEAIGQLGDTPVWVRDATRITAANLASHVTQLHSIHGLSCLIVDYLQLMSGGNGESQRYLEVGNISRALKEVALQLDIPVIALSQLSRAIESRGPDAEPRLSDLRESGNIEQDADNVIFIHRAGEAPTDQLSEAELIVAKQRDGEPGRIRLFWNPTVTKFLNAEMRHA